jgi:fimbrial chaperone protein
MKRHTAQTLSAHSFSRAAFGLALSFGITSPAFAGSFAVNPVRVTLSAGQAVAALTVHNNAKEPTVVQLETSAWSQRDGSDVLTPTAEILATPPIFTIAPGGSQIVRVGLRRTPDVQHELTYRLFLREVPPPEPMAQGLRVALAVSLPVFVTPQHPGAPKLVWHVARLSEGQIQLRASNTGSAHVQIGRFELSLTENGQMLAAQTVSAYVLPDDTRTWILKSIPGAAQGGLVGVSAQTDAGESRARIAFDDVRPDSSPSAAVASLSH